MDSIQKVIASKSDNDPLKSHLMGRLAFEYSYVSLDSGLVIAKNAMTLATKQNNAANRADIFNVLGTIYNDKADYKMAIDCYTEGRKIAEHLNLKKLLSNIYTNISTTQNILKDYQNGKHYLFESIKLIKELNSPQIMAPAYLNLGSLYLNMDITDSALYYFDLALASPKNSKSFTAMLLRLKSPLLPLSKTI